MRKEKILETAEKILKSKQPSTEFLRKYDFIKVTKDYNMPEDFILLYATKERKFFIKKEDLSKVPSFLTNLQKTKTKKELKEERKLNKLEIDIKSLFPKYIEKINILLSSFPNSEYHKTENVNFVITALISHLSYLQKERQNTFSKKELLEVISTLLNEKKFSKPFLSFIKNGDLNLSSMGEINNPKDFFTDSFERLFILRYRKQINEFETKKIKECFILNEKIKVNLVFRYKDTFLKKFDFEGLSNLNKINYPLNNFIISEKEIFNYIRKIFNRTIEDIDILQDDLLLKESLFEDFKEKIYKIKNNNIRLSFNISQEDQTAEDFWNKVVSALLSEVFDINAKRLFGFQRSFKRKIIQKNIELDNFKSLFPKARNQKRELIYIKGETNSGKTYTAFEMAKNAQSGIYAAPLRLLALEGQQEFEKRGIVCSMLTGEERDEKPESNFTSSTVEMIDYSKEYEIAIIDEVQMLNDIDRGHAWFEAIVGVNAKKVILIGSEDIEDILIEIADYLEEQLEIKSFKRKTKLEFNKNLFEHYMKTTGKLPNHSAVIAFSKKDVLDLKNIFETKGNKVSVIYGALPPQVRRSETERFVSGETNVVIATDAIGMGLNLPIEHLFFYKKEKFNGKQIAPVEAHLVKQIVGRAGRYNKFDIGYVSAMSEDVFNFIEKEFQKSTKIKQKSLKCSPNYAIINQIQEITGETSIYKLLQNYNNSIRFDFDIKNHMNEYSYMIARFIDEAFITQPTLFTLKEKVKLVNAPISMDRGFKVLDLYKSCMRDIKTLRTSPEVHPISVVYERLQELSIHTQNSTELSIKKIDLLSWLAFNFEEFACLKEDIEIKRKELNKALIKYLRKK